MDWIARYYNEEGKQFLYYEIDSRTEQEAISEVMADVEARSDVDDWTLSRIGAHERNWDDPKLVARFYKEIYERWFELANKLREEGHTDIAHRFDTEWCEVSDKLMDPE